MKERRLFRVPLHWARGTVECRFWSGVFLLLVLASLFQGVLHSAGGRVHSWHGCLGLEPAVGMTSIFPAVEHGDHHACTMLNCLSGQAGCLAAGIPLVVRGGDHGLELSSVSRLKSVALTEFFRPPISAGTR